MGREILIKMAPKDEELFIEQLAKKGPIKIFHGGAASIEEVWLESLPAERNEKHEQFFIWCTAFPFEPRVSPSKGSEKFFYLDNKNPPLLEYDRERGGSMDRIYWSKPYGTPPYDEADFDKWFGSIKRWVQKYGLKSDKHSGLFMPHAAKKMGLLKD